MSLLQIGRDIVAVSLDLWSNRESHCSDQPARSHGDCNRCLYLATDAYIYGYSLITSEIARVRMNKVAPPQDSARQ